MDYLLNVAGLERHLPLCKVSDDLYIAAFIMFNDVEVTVACASKLLEKAPEFDVIITAESLWHMKWQDRQVINLIS